MNAKTCTHAADPSPSFTPGPWHLCKATRDRPNLAPIIRDAGGFAVAQAVQPANSRAGHIDAHANARLIAAAPELVGAVEMVLDASEDGGDMEDIDWDQLRAALAKAKGGGA